MVRRQRQTLKSFFFSFFFFALEPMMAVTRSEGYFDGSRACKGVEDSECELVLSRYRKTICRKFFSQPSTKSFSAVEGGWPVETQRSQCCLLRCDRPDLSPSQMRTKNAIS